MFLILWYQGYLRLYCKVWFLGRSHGINLQKVTYHVQLLLEKLRIEILLCLVINKNLLLYRWILDWHHKRPFHIIHNIYNSRWIWFRRLHEAVLISLSWSFEFLWVGFLNRKQAVCFVSQLKVLSCIDVDNWWHFTWNLLRRFLRSTK